VALVGLGLGLGQAFTVAGWNSLDALSTEMFPTSARTTGMGLLSATGRLSSVVAMVINGSLQANIVLMFVVTGSATVLGAVTSFFLPFEPSGMSLDGHPATQSFQPVVADHAI
jgi:hypothetical protein